MGDGVLREREQGQQIPPWRERLCVCVSVYTPLIVSVFSLLLKQELLSILKMTLALTLSPALALALAPGYQPQSPQQGCPLPCRHPGQRHTT